MTNIAALGGEIVERLFPFFFLLGPDLVVVGRGPSLGRLEPKFAKGALAEDLLLVEKPTLPWEIGALRAVGDRRVSIRLRQSGVVLRGQLVRPSEGSGVLFLGAPRPISVKDLVESGLSIHDYAAHDPVADFIYQMEAKDDLIRELTEAAADSDRNEADTGRRVGPSSPHEELFSAVSHELRTALNGVLGMNELARTARSGVERDEWMTRVDQNANALRHIVEEVLEVCQLDAHSTVVDLAPTSLARAVEQVAAEAWTAGHAKGIDIRIDVDPAVPEWVLADGSRLRRIAGQLLDNAIKFTDVGHVEIAIRQEARSGSKVGVSLWVTDTGVGIPEAFRVRVFDRFFRVDASATRRHGGVGLGLTLARRHAELMGGTVEVDSQPGQGSQFRISLEFEVIDDQAVAELGGGWVAAESSVPGSSSDAPPLRVLVVEDSPDSRRFVRAALQREGHWIDEATDGVQAVARACTRAYDLVLLDIEMPGMDGIEAARCIREHEARTGRPPTPMVVLTAHGLPSYRARAREAGVNACMSKPISRRELVAIANAYGYSDGAVDVVAAPLLDQQVPTEAEPAVTPDAPDDGLAPHPDCMDPDTQELFPLFLDSRYEELTHLHALLDAADFAEMARIGHTLKGTGGCYGYPLLSEIGLQLESAARAADEHTVVEQVRRYEQTMRRIERWVDASGWVTKPPIPEAFRASNPLQGPAPTSSR